IVAVQVAGARIFTPGVEHLASPAQEQIEGLSLEAVQPLHQTGSINLAIKRIERAEQATAFTQAFQGDLQVHVVAGVAAGIKRTKGRPEPAWAVAENAADANIIGQTGGGIVGPTIAGHDRAKPGLVLRLTVVRRREIVAGHDPVSAAAMARVAVRE